MSFVLNFSSKLWHVSKAVNIAVTLLCGDACITPAQFAMQSIRRASIRGFARHEHIKREHERVSAFR